MNHLNKVGTLTLLVGLGLTGAQLGTSALKSQASGASNLSAGSEALRVIKRHVDPRDHADNTEVALETPFGQLDWAAVRESVYLENQTYKLKTGGFTLELTLDPQLQKDVQATLDQERYIGAAVVMIDSGSGAIRAIGERQSDFDSPLRHLRDEITRARAPAASLMKMITAAAAIEDSGLEPESEIPFRGGCQHLRNRNWLSMPSADRSKFTLSRAFATSCNTAFARLAIYQTGLLGLREYASRFYLNRPIPSDLVIETSVAALPELETATTFDVGEAGAGFGFSKITPIHAALLSAALANQGKLMAPHLVQRAFDSDGNLVYEAKPLEIGAPLLPESADKMMVLMRATVLEGTSRSHFMRRGTRRFRTEIGGKTGTLRDLEDRKTLYTWFSGVGGGTGAEANKLALGVLVASPINWLVRASSVASNSLGRYYALRNSAHAADQEQRSSGRRN
jgi:cell division protein FtsI/penicillin-binding protein 2